MASSRSAASLTVRAIGPAVSRNETSADTPWRLMSPGVTRTPTRLLNDAGTLIEPPVSAPIPTSPRLAARAAAVPLLEPPASRSRSYGFLVTPDTDENENHDVAKSGSVVFARTMAPAFFSRAMTVASALGT